MAINLTTFRVQVDVLVAVGDNEIPSADREALVKTAVQRYSKDASDTQTDDVIGDGGRYYVITSILSSWSEGFSRIIQIELPAADITNDELPQLLESDDWNDTYWKDELGTQTRYLLLPNHSPAVTDTMRITYTIPYVFVGDPEASEVPEQDFQAVSFLAAAFVCYALAANYASIGESTIAADSVAHTTKSAEYEARGMKFEGLYRNHLGLDADQIVKSAGSFVDWDTKPGWPPGRDYIYHGSETR